MAPQKERLYCWTVCTHRKPGVSEEDYHTYMSEVYAPVVKDLIVKYGIISWEITHNTSETRLLMNQLVSPQFTGTADYDCIVQGTFRNIEDIVKMRADPIFKEKVAPDYEKHTDSARSKITVGWIEHHVLDNKIVQ